MSSVFDWSTTAATNASADSAIDASEGHAPSLLNDNDRQIMARVRELVNELAAGRAATNSGNAYAVTTGYSLSSTPTNSIIGFTVSAANTGAATLNVDGLGATAIVDPHGNALRAGALQAGGRYRVSYNGTAFQLVEDPYSANVDALAGLTLAANALPYATGAGALATTTLTAAGRGLLDDADEAAMRATLGLTVGSDVQAYDAELAAIGALPAADGNIIVGNGTTWTVESGAIARSSLGLGTSNEVEFNGVTAGGLIVNGNITVTGTVDGVDLAALDALVNQNVTTTGTPSFSALTSSGLLTLSSGRLQFGSTDFELRNSAGTPIFFIDNSNNVACGTVYPTADDVYALGLSIRRFTEVHATNGTIQTSDAGLKTPLEPLSAPLKRIGARLRAQVGTFQWLADGVDGKIHVGVTAQAVAAEFQREGLDAGRFGLFSDGGPGRLGINYPQLNTLMLAAL